MPPVVKVSMREDAINPATNRTKLCNAAFLKGIAVRYYQHGVVLTHNNHYISNEDCCSPWWRLCWGSTCCCSEGRPPRPKCAECNLRWPCSNFCFFFRSYILWFTYCRALLRCFVRRTQKYPLLCCCHLEAGYNCYMNWEISTTVHETL